jgi:hypothetical protein
MSSRQASSPLSEKGSKKEMNNPKLIGLLNSAAYLNNG